MKAVNNNGIITTYPDIPKQFRSSIGYHLNARSMTAGELRDAGLFDVIIPEEYDSRIHDLDEIYFDSAALVFKKDLINKTWSETLAELKTKQIDNFKGQINNKLAATDWYVTRKVERSIDIPQDIQDTRVGLLTQLDTVETEINALTTKKAVVSYDFPNID
jgi:hypothetical protein